MGNSEYMTGRNSSDGTPVGEAHAIMAAAANGSGPYTAECGTQVEVIDGAFPSSDAGACPACARVTGLSI